MLRRSVRNTILAAVAVVALIGVPQVAWTQERTVDPAKAALIRRMLELTKAVELAVTGLEASITAQRAASPQIPPEFWDEFTVRARRDVPRFVELLVPIYDEHFTRAQLEQLVTFYQSPLGRHLAEVQPRITTQSLEAGGRWGRELGVEVAEELAKRGIRIPPQ